MSTMTIPKYKIYRNSSNIHNVICAIALTLTMISVLQAPIFCTSPLSNLMASGRGFIGTLYNLAKVIFPLSILISGLAMCFTKDERALQAEKKVLIGSVIGFGLCYIGYHSDGLISWIESIAAGSYTAES